jgi:hypothetical protein
MAYAGLRVQNDDIHSFLTRFRNLMNERQPQMLPNLEPAGDDHALLTSDVQTPLDFSTQNSWEERVYESISSLANVDILPPFPIDVPPRMSSFYLFFRDQTSNVRTEGMQDTHV